METPVLRTLLLITTLALAAAVAAPAPAAAQNLVAEVTVDLEKLPQQNQNKLRGLDRIVAAYVNQRQWAPDDYGYDVVMDLQIYFEEAKAVSFEDRYKAQIVVSNRSNMQYSDKRWEFALEPGVQLDYAESFDPFRSLIDYYVFMLLGYEFDKVKKFGGTPYYEQARRIAQQARFSSRYFLGWDKREEWVEELLEEDQEHLRYLNYLYYSGEWLYYDERDRETAKQFLLYAIKMLEKIRDEDKLKRFYDLNYYNYGNALAEYEEWSALSKLASLDPNPEHAEYYERLMRKR